MHLGNLREIQRLYAVALLLVGTVLITNVVYEMKQITPVSSQTPAEMVEMAGPRNIYENKMYSIRFEHPASWQELDQPSMFGRLLSANESSIVEIFGNALDEFLEVRHYNNSLPLFTVGTIETGISNMTLKSYSSMRLSHLNQSLDDFHIIASTPYVISGSPAHKIVFTSAVLQQPVKVMQIWTVKDNKVYIITYIAQPSNYYDNFLDAQTIIDSFEFTSEMTEPFLNYNMGIKLNYSYTWDLEQELPYFDPERSSFTGGTGKFDLLNANYVVFKSQLENNSDTFRERINVSSHHVADRITLSNYVAYLTESLSFLEDYRVIESIPYTLAGKPAHKIVYTYSDGQAAYKALQISTLFSAEIYSITYDAELSRYAHYLPDVYNTINTIEIFPRKSLFSSQNEDSLVYENDMFNIRLYYPADWKRVDGSSCLGSCKNNIAFTNSYLKSGFQNTVALISPLENTADNFSESVVISRGSFDEQKSETINFSEFSNLTIRSMIDSVKDFEAVESIPYTLAGKPAHKIVYTYSDGQAAYKALQVWSIIDQQIFLVKYNAEKKNYDLHLPGAQKIISSFGTLDGLNFLKYENKEEGVTILYPDNWLSADLDKSPSYLDDSGPSLLASFYPMVEDPQDHSEDVNVRLYFLDLEQLLLTNTTMQKLSHEAVLQENAANFIQSLRQEFPDLQIIQSNSFVLSSDPAQRIVYTYNDGFQDIQGQAIITINGSRLFFIIYDTAPQKFLEKSATVQKMIDSLELSSHLISTTLPIGPEVNPPTISISYPSDWSITMLHDGLEFFPRHEGDLLDGIKTNVTIRVVSATNETAEQYISHSMESLRQNLRDFKIVESNANYSIPLSESGGDYSIAYADGEAIRKPIPKGLTEKIVYTTTGADGKVIKSSEIWIWEPTDYKIYHLRFISDLENYSSYEEIVEKMFESISYNPPATPPTTGAPPSEYLGTPSFLAGVLAALSPEELADFPISELPPDEFASTLNSLNQTELASTLNSLNQTELASSLKKITGEQLRNILTKLPLNQRQEIITMIN